MNYRFSWEKHYRIIVFLLIAVFSIRVLHVINVKSPTYDETTCLNASLYLMQSPSWDHTITVQHPPLSYFWHGIILNGFSFASFDNRLFWAKICMLFFPALLGIFIFKWGKELFGVRAGLAALALFTLCPNVIAHSGLITQDILVTTFIFLSVYSFEHFLKKRSFKTAAFAGAMLGLALLSKYTAVFLAPIYLIRLVFDRFLEREKLHEVYAKALLVFVIGLFVLNLGYLFKGTGKPLGSYALKSSFFNSLSGIPVISGIPAPFPSPYIYGFDIQKYVAELGHPSYLMGEAGTEGWKQYFIIAFLIKTPVTVLLLLLAAVPFLGRDFRKKLPLLIPVFSLTVPFIVLTQSNPGIRYMLPVFPFMYIIAGEIVNSKTKALSILAAVCIAGTAVESFAAHPNYISYFNLFIGGPANGYKYLADSNVDWGQEQKAVQEFMDKSRNEGKSISVLPRWPAEGTVLVNANNLADCFRMRKKYDWLKDFEPVGHIGYSWFLFDIDLDDIMQRAGGSPRMNYTAAWILSRERGDPVRAREFVDKAVSMLSSDSGRSKDDNVLLAKCHYLYGLIEADSNDAARAESRFNAALGVYPYLYEAYDALSQVHSFKGDSEKAKAFKRQSKAYRILEWYSVDISTDLNSYTDRMLRDPADHSAYNNAGFLYWAQGDIDKAIQTFEKAASIQPDFSGTYASLASCYYEKGDILKAKENLAEFRKLVFAIDSYDTQVVVWGEDRIIFDSTLVVTPEAIIPEHELQAINQDFSL